MLCDICKNKKATIYITKIINGNKQELHLCDECSKKVDGLHLNVNWNDEFNEGSISTPFTFQNLLSGIMDYMSKSPSNEDKPKELACKNCGTTYSEFKQTGLLGCSECYKNFSPTMQPVIKRVQGNSEHVGKIPKTLGKNIMKKRMVLDLKEKLQKAIAAEAYEKAAEFRDKIREIEKEN